MSSRASMSCIFSESGKQRPERLQSLQWACRCVRTLVDSDIRVPEYLVRSAQDYPTQPFQPISQESQGYSGKVLLTRRYWNRRWRLALARTDRTACIPLELATGQRA